MVSPSTRVNRSTRRVSSADPQETNEVLKLPVPFVKLVVSTTRVSPSHRPRELPSHWRTSDGSASRPVHRYDPHVVHHLVEQHHVARRLEDLHVVVVAARQHRRPGAEAEQAPLGHPARLGAVLVEAAHAHPHRVAAARAVRLGRRLGRRRQRRQPAVGRVHEQRRLGQRRRPRPVRPHLLAVTPGVARRRPVRVTGQRRIGARAGRPPPPPRPSARRARRTPRASRAA